MALFGRGKSENSDVPEDLQQYYNTSSGSDTLKWIVRIVAGLLVLGLLIWGVIWGVGKLTHSGKTQTAGNTSQQQAQDQRKAQADAAKAQADAKKAADEAQKKAADAAAKEQAAQQQTQQPQQPQTATTGGGNTSGSTTQTPAAGTQATGGSGGGTGNLPNTGPGETAAVVFAGAAILGTAAHAIVTRKRQLQ